MAAIRKFQTPDWAAVWPILDEAIRAGDTLPFAPGSSEAEIRKAWVEMPAAVYVACAPDGAILGCYYLRANQPGLGAHVSNCGYVVSPKARGQGIATLMCEHSQSEALEMGFRAMQFNYVVSTNERAVRLWTRMGFATIGRLPGAFRHSSLGYVDALVMFKQLAAS
jgi:ribosomal protein S18 acetylase RimI-like enzyme